jgi:hypothetical protein
MLDWRAASRLQIDPMHERESQPTGHVRKGQAARTPAGPQARALALQRKIGNRAAGRVLARWIKHPDPKQKGVMVSDSTAEEFTRFNPPKNE